MKDTTSQNSFVSIAFFVSLFCVGIFYEYLSCIASAVMAVWLLVNHISKNKTCVYVNLPFIAVSVVVLFYGLSAFWAVDSGMAFIGFMKYLPLLLFALCYMQTDEKAAIIIILPYAACIMTVLSAILAQVRGLSDYFLVAGRLGGFFQYPNAFALFLLISELLLITKAKIKYYDAIAIAVLITGIVYTGSRTVFVIGILANLAAVLFTKTKRFIFYSFLALLGGCFVALVYCIATDSMWIFTRLFSISFTESTFIGRLLYYMDALPVILENPFGLGYMGYYYTQPSFQTGVYSAAFIHNDLLQLMLDIGWIPALLFAAAVTARIFSKKTSKKDRIILLSMAAHSLFDFDLQFLSLFFIYLLFLEPKRGKTVVIEGKKWFAGSVSALMACVSLYVGTSLVLYRVDMFEASHKLYPWNVNTETALIIRSDDIEYSKKIADVMAERNESVLLAYSVKASYAYSQGDFASLIEYKNKIFEIAPFQYEEYEEYARMLINGINLYSESGDSESADICRKELMAVPEKLERLNDRISELGKMIGDQPKTCLPDVLTEYIEELKTADN